MGRHVLSVVLLWLVLTAIGEALVFAPMFPVVGADAAEEFDEIFRILLYMGIPVFTFVVAMVVYAYFNFRQDGDAPDEDGPAYRGTGLVPRAWLLITGGLAALVIVFPGLTGLAHLVSDGSGAGWGDTNADLDVSVQAFQFSWIMEYDDYGITVGPGTDAELVLPVDQSVRFIITSSDVVHSFWIPAFRMKMDAIPGRTTYFTVTPDRLGSYDDNQVYRVQCAELCGLNHSDMWLRVRVVEQDEFDAWVAEQRGGEES